jgi:hypothetical protein
MKKKLLTVLLIVVIVFNFICTNHVYAEPDDAISGIPESNGEGEVTTEQAKELIDNGKAGGSTVSVSSTIIGLIFQSISLMANSFPMAIQVLMTQLAKNPSHAGDNPIKEAVSYVIDLASFDTDVESFFTIQRTVFNEVALFNTDVFNFSSTYTVGTGSYQTTINQSPSMLKLKTSTAGWFYSCRLIAMMINLCVLIYIGIRMALSTVASDEARYKKMLIAWLESMVVLFLLHYIMSFAISLGNLVLNVIYNLREGMTVEGFETVVLNKIYNAVSEKTGMQVFMYSVFFWFLTFIQLKFFITYFKRTLSIMFLTIIAPFITVTYPIDKIGDGKAQAFEMWMKEYIINIAIQPIHAAIYLVFVFTAGSIAEQAPFVAMVFLLSLGRIENIVRNIFGITDSISMKNFDDELKKGKKG